MYGNVHVVTRPEYERFLDMLDRTPDRMRRTRRRREPTSAGGTRSTLKTTALACVTTERPPANLAGIWGRAEQLTGIGAFTVEGEAGDEYLRESIMEPNAKRVEGYAAQMPQYGFNDAEIDALVAFLKQLQ